MAQKFTDVQRAAWVDLQMQKAEILETIEATVYTDPEDLETESYADAIAAKEEEMRALFEAPTTDLEEYRRHADALKAELNTLREHEQQRQGRNEMKVAAAVTAHEATKTAHEASILALREEEKTAIGFKPPYEERKVEEK
jgi:hypothetical protein